MCFSFFTHAYTRTVGKTDFKCLNIYCRSNGDKDDNLFYTMKFHYKKIWILAIFHNDFFDITGYGYVYFKTFRLKNWCKFFRHRFSSNYSYCLIRSRIILAREQYI